MSNGSIRLLLIEDNLADARLMLFDLQRAGLDVSAERVDTERELIDALARTPDVILCDWNLPQFDALRVLEIVRERDSETPILIVSGSVGEEAAVEAMRLGAADYLLKDRLGRLPQAIMQAMKQRSLRAAEQRAREQLRDREEQYRILAETIPQMVWSALPDGTFDYMNQRAAAYIGRDIDEVQGKFWQDLIHPDDLDSSRKQWRAATERQSPLEFECRIRDAEGGYRWHVNRAMPIRDSYGKIARWFGTCTDIHEQKLTSERLTRDAMLLANVRDAVIVVDLQGCITYWNEGATRIFGWEANDMLGARFGTRLPETRRHLEAFRRADDDTSRLVAEYEEIRIDGVPIWIHSRFTHVYDAAGRRAAVLCVVYDISEQKRAEKSLSAIMRSVNDGIITICEVGIIESANPAAERMFGYSNSELVGAQVSNLMSEPYRSEHAQYLETYRNSGIAKIIGMGREIVCLRKDGSQFAADLSVTEFVFEGRRRFAGVIRDITERKRLEEQFHLAQRMEAVGRLAGGVAHDFNNLLTIINSYSELLLPDTPPDSIVRNAISAIRDAGERAAGLTSQLLAFSRKAIVEPKVINLNQMISQSERLLGRLIGEDIHLAVILDPSVGSIRIDPSQFDQVIMNLAVNARDAMPVGGSLTIETKRLTVTSPKVAGKSETSPDETPPGEYAEVIFRDTGMGIDPATMENIFEPFFTTKEPGKGTGLGLAVVHGVVKQAGAHIAVESEPGSGAVFRLRFPVVPDSIPNATTSATPAAPATRKTILLVEDDDAVRRVTRVALETRGYQVFDAPHGMKALEMASSGEMKIDLLITDVVMPGMSGRQLADTMRKSMPTLRVLFVSGYTDDAILLHGVERSADSLLPKPFTPMGLARKVASIIE